MSKEKGFDPFDQSVPCPDFGQGAVMRFTFGDLRKVETHGSLALALASDTVREVMPIWSWITFQLANRSVEFSTEIFKIGLKKAGGKEPIEIDWEDPPRFNFVELCSKAEIAILASLHGQTIEEAQAEAKKARERVEGNPPTAQAEGS
jgi:hypothetical protein